MLSSVHKSQSIILLFTFYSYLFSFLLAFFNINRWGIYSIRQIVDLIMLWSLLSSFQGCLVVREFDLIHQIRFYYLYIVILVNIYLAFFTLFIESRFFGNCYFEVDYISLIECCVMRLHLLRMILASMRHHTKWFMFCYWIRFRSDSISCEGWFSKISSKRWIG